MKHALRREGQVQPCEIEFSLFGKPIKMFQYTGAQMFFKTTGVLASKVHISVIRRLYNWRAGGISRS